MGGAAGKLRTHHEVQRQQRGFPTRAAERLQSGQTSGKPGLKPRRGEIICQLQPVARTPASPRRGFIGHRPHHEDAPVASGDQSGVSGLLAVTLDEAREGFELLFDEITSGIVFQIARFVIELCRTAADEHFRLVQS